MASCSDTASSVQGEANAEDGRNEWMHYKDDDIMQQQSAIQADEAKKIPFVGDKEPISKLATEYEEGSVIFKDKIEALAKSYSAIRRTQGDGNCFFRAFMFSYLERIMEAKDEAEVKRVMKKIDRCKQTLLEQAYAEFTFEDFFGIFIEQLESVLPNNEQCPSIENLVERSRDPLISNYVVMFFRFVTAAEIRRRAEFFQDFIVDCTVDQFCKTSVEPMGEESDHVHVTALSDALGIPIRVIYLDRNPMDPVKKEVCHHDFVPSNCLASESGIGSVQPYVVLLYRPGHYDIVYPKEMNPSEST
eukprot:TRINITY_DN8218_c0_g1_i1.p1 TRINITY_DN8218_c0_g1~~TRINITY_DN8218_c0_g1_i1.p1  ORF type:complete len:339 (+),score=69.16 TRINITY_DN8218_c0_g1_i1:110-1018(+)